jgi:hypothetical protein
MVPASAGCLCLLKVSGHWSPLEPPALIPTASQLAHRPVPKAARVVVQSSDAKPARAGAADVRADQGAQLHVLLQCTAPGDPGRNIYFSDAAHAEWGDSRIPEDRLAKWPTVDYGPINIRWCKIEPERESYSNGEGASFAWTRIGYVRTRVPDWDNRSSVAVNVDPIVHPARLPGYGTMRYMVEVFVATPSGGAPKVVASPGLEQAKRAWGIGSAVTRVSVRKDDTYVGWLYAWGNVPYVYGSESPTGKAADHQAELFLGSDCCDTLVAAARAMGRNVQYTSTYGLGEETRTIVARGAGDREGIIVAAGVPVRWGPTGVQPGDVAVVGPRADHAVAFLEDRGQPGVLDTGDLVLHHLRAAPALATLGDAWDCSAVSVYRFR